MNLQLFLLFFFCLHAETMTESDGNDNKVVDPDKSYAENRREVMLPFVSHKICLSSKYITTFLTILRSFIFRWIPDLDPLIKARIIEKWLQI